MGGGGRRHSLRREVPERRLKSSQVKVASPPQFFFNFNKNATRVNPQSPGARVGNCKPEENEVFVEGVVIKTLEEAHFIGS